MHNLLKHAIEDNCNDPDCELHNPEVMLEEGTGTEVHLAYYVAGACEMWSLINEGLKVGFTLQQSLNAASGEFHDAHNIPRAVIESEAVEGYDGT